MKGVIFDIQRFALHDGPGIRTTVFMKGCPLRCVWCHNPESHSFKLELSFDESKCDGCASCLEACRVGVHAMNPEHDVNFAVCQTEHHCVEACPSGALKIIGREVTIDDVLEEVLRDVPYFVRSGGGMTISGGEPLSQFLFTLGLLREAKRNGLHTCLDTSGMASQERAAAVAEYVDLFLFDYKASDEGEHRRLTGVSNRRILENLDCLYRLGARIILRCPLVPGINDSREHLSGIAALSERYPNLEAIEIMPYHNMGRDKYAQIGRDSPIKDLATADEVTKSEWVTALHRLGCTRACIG